MTEKRSDYRKQIKRKKNNGLLHTIKSAFDDSDEAVDVNPDFMREPEEKEHVAQKTTARTKREKQLHATRESNARTNAKAGKKQDTDKSLLLKKKLNRAILIVIVLIVLVLLALFHL
ncbi:hypothetical protein PT287_03455 [Lactobacillus sp. ESL0679]|uniref:hypothetical protein n=1 Tax=Lactobacillus sp. ESL0679 TaxID=2983209 RepID=UPI0023F6EFC3|nr:hypothetical protein [Lactobacillus sp. ESL0679]MDF7682579.1 hypothetical protein [Lactobacillus sp. ESL0679]